MGEFLYRVRSLIFFGRTITGDQAFEIAKKECAKRKWPFVEPYEVAEGIFRINIRTNMFAFGSYVIVSVRASDGKVMSANFHEP